MQKVFQSCDELDRYCYEVYGLSEDILMEHAARGMATYIQEHFRQGSTLLIVSGVGNNGADGIALARQLHREYDVRLSLPFGVRSKMAKQQLTRAKAVGVKMVEVLEDADIVIDALFGAGLSRDLDDKTQSILHRLNTFKAYKIACDIPTGVGKNGSLMPMAFRADITLTMGAYKEALFLDESKESIGKILRINLGIADEIYERKSRTYLLESSDLKLPSRSTLDTHKGTFGHVAVFCGEKEGAGIIAGMAASRFGAGLTTLVVHETLSSPAWLMHSTVVPQNASAIAIGMGLGDYFERTFLQKYVIESTLPIVLDADSFSHHEILDIVKQKEREVILTPHPKEFTVVWKYLTGEEISVADLQKRRFEMVRKFTILYPHVTLLLKGATMLIAQGKQLYINPLGSSKLSKGGSGDVLSGLIVALLAQGYRAIEAAIHGSIALTLTADYYRGASYAMLPIDLIDALEHLEASSREQKREALKSKTIKYDYE